MYLVIGSGLFPLSRCYPFTIFFYDKRKQLLLHSWLTTAVHHRFTNLPLGPCFPSYPTYKDFGNPFVYDVAFFCFPGLGYSKFRNIMMSPDNFISKANITHFVHRKRCYNPSGHIACDVWISQRTSWYVNRMIKKGVTFGNWILEYET